MLVEYDINIIRYQYNPLEKKLEISRGAAAPQTPRSRGQAGGRGPYFLMHVVVFCKCFECFVVDLQALEGIPIFQA